MAIPFPQAHPEGRIMFATARPHQPTPPTAPFILRRGPSRPDARRWAERAWSLYPPAALLLGVFIVAGGCKSWGGDDEGAPAAAMSTTSDPSSDPERPSATVEAILFPCFPAEARLAGDADGRATIRYGKDRIELANLSESPWSGARIWVNEKYSALLPYTKAGEIRSIHFDFLRDENGKRFPTDNSDVLIEKIDLITGDERTNVRFGLGY